MTNPYEPNSLTKMGPYNDYRNLSTNELLIYGGTLLGLIALAFIINFLHKRLRAPNGQTANEPDVNSTNQSNRTPLLQ